MTKEEADHILNLPIEHSDVADTIRGYFIALLKELLIEEEGFSGKRPFGNGGWMYDLWTPMVKAGLVQGRFDSYGGLEEIDDQAATRLLTAAAEHL